MSFKNHENNENYDEYNLPKRRVNNSSHLKIPSPTLGNTPTKLVSPSAYLRNLGVNQNYKNSAEKIKDRNQTTWCDMQHITGLDDRFDTALPLLDRSTATMALNSNGEFISAKNGENFKGINDCF